MVSCAAARAGGLGGAGLMAHSAELGGRRPQPRGCQQPVLKGCVAAVWRQELTALDLVEDLVRAAQHSNSGHPAAAAAR